jgi:hypothetical protein
MHERIDVIGDIHGHCDALLGLLHELGYRHERGAWRHPERTALFLGDFIDRGPKQVEVVRTVRAMVDAESALAVMGNHEFNALCWVRRDERPPHAHLRPHDVGRLKQHRDFLAQVGEGSALHHELLAWFMTLPLWLELPHARAIHACWDSERIARVRDALGPGERVSDSFLQHAGRKDTPLFDDVEVLLKGLEARLPDGRSFTDGHSERHHVRVRWWQPPGDTLESCAILPDGHGLPDDLRVTYEALAPPDARPCFVGHYWHTLEPGASPRLFAPHVACVDLSIGKEGHLAAYRHDGERVLNEANYVVVDGAGRRAPTPA